MSTARARKYNFVPRSANTRKVILPTPHPQPNVDMLKIRKRIPLKGQQRSTPLSWPHQTHAQPKVSRPNAIRTSRFSSTRMQGVQKAPDANTSRYTSGRVSQEIKQRLPPSENTSREIPKEQLRLPPASRGRVLTRRVSAPDPVPPTRTADRVRNWAHPEVHVRQAQAKQAISASKKVEESKHRQVGVSAGKTALKITNPSQLAMKAKPSSVHLGRTIEDIKKLLQTQRK